MPQFELKRGQILIYDPPLGSNVKIRCYFAAMQMDNYELKLAILRRNVYLSAFSVALLILVLQFIRL